MQNFPPSTTRESLTPGRSRLHDAYPIPHYKSIWVLLIPIAVMLFPFFLHGKVLSVVTLMIIFAISGQGLNFLVGYSGQVSLCQGALFGIGTYGTLFLVRNLGFPFWVALPAAGLITTAASIVFTIPATKSKPYYYLAAATLAAQLIFGRCLAFWKAATYGGPFPQPPPTIAFLGMETQTQTVVYFAAMGCFALCTLFVRNLLFTRYGRALAAIRENTPLAAGLGIRVFPSIFMSFCLCSFLAGLAGGLYSLSEGRFSAQDSGFSMSLVFLLVAFAGGLGRLSGPLFGAALVVLLKEFAEPNTIWILNVFGSSLSGGTLSSPFWECLWGLLIILFITLQPQGLAAWWQRLRVRQRAWPLPPEEP